MNEEKLRCTPGSIPPLTAGSRRVQRSASGHGKGRRGGGIRGRSPRLHCEGDMRKHFEALTGVKLDDDVSWEIVVVQKDRSLSEWGARPNKAAPLLYLSSAVSLSSRCGAGDWMACRPWSPTG